MFTRYRQLIVAWINFDVCFFVGIRVDKFKFDSMKKEKILFLSNANQVGIS